MGPQGEVDRGYICATKYRLEKMNRIPDEVEVTERQEDFIFVYYNHARVLYGKKKATMLTLELNQRLAIPLKEKEVYATIGNVDSHVEDPCDDVHADGFYIFSTRVMVKFLPISEEKAREMGFLTSLESRARYKRNQEDCLNRDKEIAWLWLKGYSVKKILSMIKGSYLYVSQRSINRTLSRLDLTKERNIAYEDIDFEGKQRFKRTSKSSNKCATSPRTKNRSNAMSGNSKDSGCEPHEGTDPAPAKEERCVQPPSECLGGYVDSCPPPADTVVSDIHKAFQRREDMNILGKGGTGKSTLIQKFKAEKGVLTLAPTGKAASVVGGKTIHSGLGISIRDNYDEVSLSECQKLCDKRFFSKLKTIIIDEIGMVPLSTFQFVKKILSFVEDTYGYKINLVTVGDMAQMEPVNGEYVFHDEHFNKAFVLKKNYRQNGDHAFRQALDQISEGDASGLTYINQHARHSSGYLERAEALDRGAIYLTTHRDKVESVNRLQVRRHRNDPSFRLVHPANGNGNIVPVYVGLPVIFTANERRFKKGMIGKIVDVQETYVKVSVENHVYKVKQMDLKDGSIQYPFEPCYAMTTHKAQGSTFDQKVYIDASRCFAAGQLYTMLSRVRSISQLVLVHPLEQKNLIVSQEVLDYMKHIGSATA